MTTSDFPSLKNLTDKDSILDRPFLVKDKVKGIGKNGKMFLSLLLGDKSGHMDARIWDRAEELSELFDIGDILLVKGQVQLYLGRRQIIVHRLEKAADGRFAKSEFLIEDVEVDVRGLYSELMQLISEIQSSHLKQLMQEVLQEEEIKNLLMKSPAAKSIHHAKKGGLLEHIVSVCKVLKMMAGHYQYLNSDLLIFGGVFHDLGKVWELEIQNNQIQYSHRGRLLGHMQLSCELIDRKSKQILGFPTDLRDVLKHIVLSHHGRLEYGSPVRPYFPEAYIVASIDELDSKMDTMWGFIQMERETGNSWSRYNEHFDRYFYLENLKGRWN